MSLVLVRGARQLLTLRGNPAPRRGYALRDLGIIPDGAVLIRDGVIEAVGPGCRIENLRDARHAREIDVSGRVVMPGFIDSHTHLVCGPPRLIDYDMRIAGSTYQEIANAGGGILMSMRAIRGTPITRLISQSRARLKEFVRHGTTTIEAKSGYGLDEAGEWKTLRAVAALNGPVELVPTYLGAHVVPPEFKGRADEYIEWMCSHFLPKIRRRKLARFVDIYCDEGAFNLAQAKRYLSAAGQLGFLLKMHTEQFSRNGGVRLAVETQVVSADHLEYATEEDAALLADSPVIATLLPGAVFHLGLDRYPPARNLIDVGAAVALATDFNPGTSPTYSMQMVLSLACAQMRMTPAEAISAATINAAHALSCAERVGSLEAGKDADLIVLKASDHREIPYHFGVNLVSKTIKKGIVLYDEPEVKWPERS